MSNKNCKVLVFGTVSLLLIVACFTLYINQYKPFEEYESMNMKTFGGNMGQVPNIVHFNYFSDADYELTFVQYLSILSVHKFQKPKYIYFHTNKKLKGEYFQKIQRTIPKFRIRMEEPPKSVFGETIKFNEKGITQSDVHRVLIMLTEGGIYLDLDVFVIQSLEPLRKYDCVFGKETHEKLCAGIILAKPGSIFVRLWLEHFLGDDYKIDTWAYNSGVVPTRIARRYPHFIHIENKTMQRPAWDELEQIYGPVAVPWRHLYTLHLWNSAVKKSKYPHLHTIKPSDLQKYNSTFYQVARHIYYNEQ